jgi:hypothetical protein
MEQRALRMVTFTRGVMEEKFWMLQNNLRFWSNAFSCRAPDGLEELTC